MERLVWDLQQIVRDLESIPGALVRMEPQDADGHDGGAAAASGLPNNNNNNNNEQQQPHSAAACASAHRRALRRLDRALKQWEHESAAAAAGNYHCYSIGKQQLQQQQQQHQSQSQPQDSSTATTTTTTKTTASSIDINSRHDARNFEDSNSNQNQHQHGHHQQQGMSSHNAPRPQVSVLPQDLLILLLTRLALPLATNDGTTEEAAFLPGKLAASILERLVPLWIASTTTPSNTATTTPTEDNSNPNHNDGNSRPQQLLLLPDGALVALLRRSLECRASIENSNIVNNSNSDSNTPFLWNASLAWLRVLNHHFAMLEEEKERPGGTPEVFDSDPPQQPQPQQLLLQQPWFLAPTAAECLRSALASVHAKPWEPVADAVAEAQLQWRVLTGYLLAAVVRVQRQQRQQQQQESIPQWLYRCFQQASTNHNHGAIDGSIPEPVLRSTVQNLLTTLLAYVTELTDYALDALDGAAIAFQSSARRGQFHDHSNNRMNVDDANGNNINKEAVGAAAQIEAFANAGYAVEDSLRHVSLAAQLLESIQPWCRAATAVRSDSKDLDFAARLEQVQKQQLIHLWVTVAPAFMERSNVTTVLNYKQRIVALAEQQQLNQEGNYDNLGFRICHLRLQLAEMVLSREPSSQQPGSKQTSGSSGYETSLCLTFLRGLEHPELLWNADSLWHTIEQRLQQQQQQQQRQQQESSSSISENRDLQRMLRAAVLTLRQQHMLPIAIADRNNNSHTQQQRGAQAIVQRLLPLLTPPEKSNRGDPWDGFFVRQSAGLVIPTTTTTTTMDSNKE